MTEVAEGDEYLMEFMKAQVRDRKADVSSKTPGERKAAQTDIFTMLVEANEEEAGKFKLDDGELVSSSWTFYLFFIQFVI